MSAIWLAVLSALSIGGADFVGGRASRHASATGVVAVAQTVDIVGLSLIALIAGAQPSGADLAWGGVAGIVGAVAFVAFLVALARGPMSIVSPFTAIFGVATPVAIGLASGERPSMLVWIGVVVGLAAIALASKPATEPPTTGVAKPAAAPPATGVAKPAASRRATLMIAALAGVGFGVFIAILDETRSQAGTTPLVAGRIVGVLVLLGLLRLRRESLPSGAMRRQALLMGVLETIAVASLIAALHRGALVPVSVLSSMYPVTTVLLAVVVLRERLETVHRVGVGFALAAVALIAAG